MPSQLTLPSTFFRRSTKPNGHLFLSKGRRWCPICQKEFSSQGYINHAASHGRDGQCPRAKISRPGRVKIRGPLYRDEVQNRLDQHDANIAVEDEVMADHVNIQVVVEDEVMANHFNLQVVEEVGGRTSTWSMSRWGGRTM